MISRQTIDAVFSAARVEEVIGDFISLKRSGSNLKGLSPFTDEKTPSFMVSPAKQIWKDFSSGKGGNVVTFLMEHEQFNYPEALRWLAKKYGIEIIEDRQRSEEEKEELKQRESLYIITEFAKKYFKEQLKETEEGKAIGLSYFKERGFTAQTIEKFELGYSPAKRNAFTEYAQKKGYGKHILEASGLSIFRDGSDYGFDRFRERVIFPIQSFSGRTLGFGARIMRSDVKTAKYLNSPENEIYHKSKILYGIYQSKQAIQREDECLLVEGYTDVISMHQSGIENVVSSSGTSLTVDQIRLIKRLTPNIIILFDGDAAGIRASFRSIDMILEQELNVKVLLFPDGDDPDAFARKHDASYIKDYLSENATDFIRFKAKVLMEEAVDDPVKMAEMIRDIINSIALLPNVIQRELYIRDTAKLLEVREEVLFKELEQARGRKRAEENRRRRSEQRAKPMQVVKEEPVVVNPREIIEEKLIRLLMHYGDLIVKMKGEEEEYETTVIEEIISQFEENELDFKNPLYQSVYEDIREGCEQQELRTGDFFVKLFDEEKNEIASDALIDKYTISKNWEEKHNIYIQPREKNISKELEDTVLKYKTFYLDEEIRVFSEMLKGEELEGEAREEHMEKIMKLTALRAEIFKALHRVV